MFFLALKGVVLAGEEVVLVEVLEAAVAMVAGRRVAPLGGEVVAQAGELTLGEGAGEVGAVPLDQDTQHQQEDIRAIHPQ